MFYFVSKVNFLTAHLLTSTLIWCQTTVLILMTSRSNITSCDDVKHPKTKNGSSCIAFLIVCSRCAVMWSLSSSVPVKRASGAWNSVRAGEYKIYAYQRAKESFDLECVIMAPIFCPVNSCASEAGDIRCKFNWFLSNRVLMQAWAYLVRCGWDKDWTPTKWSLLCSLHFTPDAYTCNMQFLKSCS